MKQIYTVPPEHEYSRLDKVLAEVCPETGLRYRRRLCDDGRVLVDGKSRKPGYKVRAGQSVEISEGGSGMTADALGLTIVKQAEEFAAIYKPGRVHSAAIAGKDTSSVEDVLGELFPSAEPVLLNRLDFLTSGLLLVALSENGQQAYLDMEETGEIKKFYRATIKGRLDGLVTIKNRLDTDNRKTTKVLDEADDDVRRWTDVEVLSHDREGDTTEVRCLIMKGARHQIRAHLASIGHPIVGDPLYSDGNEEHDLLLLHQRIEFPGFAAEVDGAE